MTYISSFIWSPPSFSSEEKISAQTARSTRLNTAARRMELSADWVRALGGNPNKELPSTNTKFQNNLNQLLESKVSYPRFTLPEIQASSDTKHEMLWQSIFTLEATKHLSAKWDDSKLGARIRWNPKKHLSGNTEQKLISLKYLDRGVESIVYMADDGMVHKLREIHPYSANSVLDELAKIVYHNYLFPTDEYILNHILRYEENGYKTFFLDLTQPLVIPQTDEKSRIIAPSYRQITKALQKLPLRFNNIERGYAHDYDSSDEEDDDDPIVNATRLMAYNEQFVLYDFNPGANTFIDSKTGEVRFIDPRVNINSKGEPTLVSSFGTRRRYDGLLEI